MNEYPNNIKELWEERIHDTPQKVFIIEKNKKYSYGVIDELANTKINILKKLGIKKGDIVALQFELNIKNIVMIIACIKLEVVINPLNPHFDIDEIKNLLIRFKPHAIIAQHALRGRDTFFNIEKLNGYSISKFDDLKYFIRKKSSNLFRNYVNDIESPLLILNTSGTSGLPKGVVLTNKNILAAEYGYNSAFGITNTDMILMPSGMYHAIGFHHGLISTIIAGSTMVIMRHYNLKEMAALIIKYPITYIDSLPTVMYDILYKLKSLNNLKMLVCGGDKIKKSLLNKAKARHIPLYNCYGLTEAVPFSYTPKKYFEEHGSITTAVKPISNVDVRLIKNKIEILQPNIQGMIEVRGSILFKEYLGQPDKTANAFDNGWFITGDLGHYTSDNLIEVDGRSSDKIIRGGENISARAVEDKVRNCNNIKDVAVLGISDIRLGQRIGAFVVLKRPDLNMNKEKLINALKDNKVDKKLWPEKLWIVNSLPKTANGKIKKYILKQIAEE
ncbi:AMP-binding protein [Lactobacillus sp. PSON]|uniref:AMP-binding protein n=1 Tax=Lactobacillus sp. PSON TaxID=3455454 RepID=UPI0040438ACB